MFAAAAYRSRGYAEPDPDRFPRADLAEPSDEIDIADVIVIRDNYGAKFGEPSLGP